MTIKPINTKKDYKNTLKRIEELWDAEPKTLEYDELDILPPPPPFPEIGKEETETREAKNRKPASFAFHFKLFTFN